MKLIYRIGLRLTMFLLPIMALWAVIFYYAMVDEINDEADDSLSDYSEMIVRLQLAGRPLPPLNSGSNNSYTIVPLDSGTVYEPYMHYHDEMVYIPEEEDTEPARVLTTIFSDENDHFYKLTVAIPTFERDDLLRAVFWHIVALYLVLLVTTLIVTTLIFHRSMHPLYKLLKWLDKYTPGRKSETLPLSDVVEFQKLTKAVGLAMSRADEYFEQQKEFIGNASHELQTPLAVIGNRIEWLINSTAITEEQYIELSKIQRSLSRLVRLNRTLLLLTKIDNGQFPESCDVDLVAIIKNELEIYNDIYADKAIVCDVNLPASFVVEMNESLANTLLSNLLKNAFLHSAEGANVSISITDRVLTVKNSGEVALDSNVVFNRFYHDGKNGSTGLGLALVSSIGRYYSLLIDYNFQDGNHCFSVGW
ncbi:MAG: HAMP domain-containing histidine kinase [Bacteroidaceae bacterium]|nr:HAMP domain-containing histidine kinase [Bacteroidaceae bacterium]